MSDTKKYPETQRMTFLSDVPEEKCTTWYNTTEGRSCEIPSACMITNARSMAKVSAIFANGGEVDGVRLLK